MMRLEDYQQENAGVTQKQCLQREAIREEFGCNYCPLGHDFCQLCCCHSLRPQSVQLLCQRYPEETAVRQSFPGLSDFRGETKHH